MVDNNTVSDVQDGINFDFVQVAHTILLLTLIVINSMSVGQLLTLPLSVSIVPLSFSLFMVTIFSLAFIEEMRVHIN